MTKETNKFLVQMCSILTAFALIMAGLATYANYASQKVLAGNDGTVMCVTALCGGVRNGICGTDKEVQNFLKQCNKEDKKAMSCAPKTKGNDQLMCPAIYMPVMCADNGLTYGNACEANIAGCCSFTTIGNPTLLQ